MLTDWHYEYQKLARENERLRERAERAEQRFEQLLRWSTEAISDRSVILGMGKWTAFDVIHCADLDATPAGGEVPE